MRGGGWGVAGSTGCCCAFYKGILVSVFMTEGTGEHNGRKSYSQPSKQTVSAASPRRPGDLLTKSC